MASTVHQAITLSGKEDTGFVLSDKPTSGMWNSVDKYLLGNWHDWEGHFKMLPNRIEWSPERLHESGIFQIVINPSLIYWLATSPNLKPDNTILAGIPAQIVNKNTCM
jgi:hypothetical protein